MAHRYVATAFVFHDQVSGVWRDDAVFAREFSDFIAQFRVFATQSDFIEQIADPSCRPKPWYELAFRSFSGELHFIGKFSWSAIHDSFDNYGGISFSGITADENELLAFEQIRQG